MQDVQYARAIIVMRDIFVSTLGCLLCNRKIHRHSTYVVALYRCRRPMQNFHFGFLMKCTAVRVSLFRSRRRIALHWERWWALAYVCVLSTQSNEWYKPTHLFNFNFTFDFHRMLQNILSKRFLSHIYSHSLREFSLSCRRFISCHSIACAFFIPSITKFFIFSRFVFFTTHQPRRRVPQPNRQWNNVEENAIFVLIVSRPSWERARAGARAYTVSKPRGSDWLADGL